MMSGMVGQRISPRRAVRRAFTLIELLVVIAIIALLIAILLPSLEAARMASKKSNCLARIKNIASSSRVYDADDPNGWAIPVHPAQYTQDPGNPTFIGAYEWGGKSGIGRPDFLGAENILNSKYGTRAGFGPATRPLNDILYAGGFNDHLHPRLDRLGALRDTKLDMEVFQCPSDDGPPRGGHCRDWIAHSERSSYDHFGTSYAANLFMIASTDGGYVFSNSPYLRPTTRIPTPARTIYYEENIGRWAWAAREDQCDFLDGIDVGPTKAIRGWHGKDWTYNRSFVDAHAESQRVYIEGTENNEGHARHYVSEKLSSYPKWDPHGEGIPNYPTMQRRSYRCVVIRGDGWAKDTLPANYVNTGFAAGGGGGGGGPAAGRYPVAQGRPSYEDCVSE